MKSDDLSANRLAVDVRQADDLRLKLKQSPREGLKQVAEQFESLFLNMMLKSMRDTLPKDGLFDSDQSRFYTSMLDQQLAQKLSTSGQMGFAKMIEQQMGRFLPPEPDSAAGSSASGAVPAPLSSFSSPETMRQALALAREKVAAKAAARAASAIPAAATDESAAPAAATTAAGNTPGNKEFVNRLWPHAVDASQATGVPAQFLVAHAALETGWGKSEIRRADGTPSYNLFGVKAGKNWPGATVEATTTEYVGGVAQTSKEKFRAYG
ncbi:MAG TPA: flagellar assembly peptidoglycan hydrolase FlgJ, partial [Azospira sp.]|nr:flagellar assembly peptidoglycan hydrolase FlgJ [Azospira sp.]